MQNTQILRADRGLEHLQILPSAAGAETNPLQILRVDCTLKKAQAFVEEDQIEF